MQGTAVHVDMWLLLEYPRPWKPKALLENDLPEAVNKHIDELPKRALEQNIRLRVQFIKQASSADIEHPRAYLADGRKGRVQLTSTTLPHYSDIQGLSAEVILNGDLPEGIAVDDEIFLVCTNGQRDLCCARFGLPLFESLAFEFGQRVWQTTHVGGHRYAPNLLCLPSGLLYGHVMPENCVDLINRHDQGEVVLEHLRGRSAQSPAAQAAEYFVRDALHENVGAIDLRSLNSERGDFEWQTERSSGRVKISEVDLGEVLASCGKPPKRDYSFELIEFSEEKND